MTECRRTASATKGKLILKRYDLCEDAAIEMWNIIIEMNETDGRIGLADRIVREHPHCDREKVKGLIEGIYFATN